MWLLLADPGEGMQLYMSSVVYDMQLIGFILLHFGPPFFIASLKGRSDSFIELVESHSYDYALDTNIQS